MKQNVHPLDELYFRKPIRQHIAEFGCVLAVIFILFSVSFAFKHKFNVAVILSICGIVIGLLGYRLPLVMKPVWQAFMKLGHFLGMIVSTVILFLMWNLVVVPLGFILKLTGKKVMNTDFRSADSSYWEIREKSLDDFKLLTRQF